MAVHAGSKRSHREISGFAREPYSPGPTASSSPRETPTRVTGSVLHSTTKDTKGTSNPTPRRANFDPSASLVLIGVRGVGKSTLGVLAATAYNRRLIDVERAFLDATGSTASTYRKANGIKEFQRKHDQVLETTLKNHETGAVIVCGFGDLEGKGAAVLQEFSQSHPVIHVTRDTAGIQSHLRGVWTEERVDELVGASSPLLRSCSNFDFFNVSESLTTHAENGSTSGLHDSWNKGNFLTLKRVERDFLRLLRNIIGDHDRGVAHHSAYPLSQIEVERRTYTFAVTIRVSEVIANNVDLERVQIGADCVDLAVEVGTTDDGNTLNDTARAFAVVRRATILPILLNVKGTRLEGKFGHTKVFKMIERCLRLGPEFCVFDLSLGQSHLHRLFERRGNSRTIGVLELRERPAEGWSDRSCIDSYVRAANMGCEIVKITMPASSNEDAFAIHDFEKAVAMLEMPSRLIAYSTGAKGRLSRCFNKILTPVEPPGPLHQTDDREMDCEIPMTAKAMTQGLFATFVFEPLMFFIYGKDVSYSVSPPMHNAAYEACGMRYTYGKHSSGSLDEFSELVRSPYFGGAAITQPFKTAAVSMLDGLSLHARAIGAVNTVIPVRELASNGNIPDEMMLLTRRHQQGPVKALYGFNTGRKFWKTQFSELTLTYGRLDWHACLHPARPISS